MTIRPSIKGLIQNTVQAEIQAAGGSGPTVLNASPYWTGIGSYVTNGTSNKLNFGTNTSFTIELWFKAQQGQSGKTMFIKNSSAVQLGLRWTPIAGTYGVDITAQPDINSSSFISVPDDNAWHHICYAFDGTAKTLRGYLDGVLKFNIAKSIQIDFTATNYYLGGASTTAGLFIGSITEFRIWNIARTEADILANWNKVISSPTSQANLKLYFQNTNFKYGNGLVDCSTSPENGQGFSLSWTSDYPPIS